MKLGFLNLLTLIFVICKLANVISWSWWLVFAPSIFGLAVIILLLALFVWSKG